MARPGFEVTVKGQYYCNDGKNKVLKLFRDEVFHLPETMIIQTGYEWVVKIIDGRRVRKSQIKKERVSTRIWLKHIVKRYCLPSRLKEKYEDFNGIRTFKIENLKPVSDLPQTEFENITADKIPTMSLSQLAVFCTMEGLTVPLDSFIDLDDAREAVKDEYQSAKSKAGTPSRVTPGTAGNPEDMHPDHETTGTDGVPEEHFTDPTLKIPVPTQPQTAAANDLME